MKQLRSKVLALAIVGLLASAAPSFAQNILPKSGDKIAFLGDSITNNGYREPMGYVNLVIAGLDANGVKATPIPAGISGHKSDQMLARVDKDVIAKKPQWMTLSCGVNDVWHGERGVPLDAYKTNIRQIVEKAMAAEIKVVILTSTMIREDQANDLNQKLVGYNDFLRELAKEKNLPVADLNADMQTQVAALQAAGQKGNTLTVDGVHMNTAGNMMMAEGILKAFGLNADQMAKAKASWQNVAVPVQVNVTYGQSEKLQKMAAAQKKSVAEILNQQLAAYLATLK